MLQSLSVWVSVFADAAVEINWQCTCHDEENTGSGSRLQHAAVASLIVKSCFLSFAILFE